MSKHDTWVGLKSSSPYKDIEHLFPEGFPMRDPFPMEIAETKRGEIVPLWIVDSDRLNKEQTQVLALVLAEKFSVSAHLVLEEAEKKGGFAMNHAWIDSMWGGAENYRRTVEFLDSEAERENGRNAQAWEHFYQQQYEDWINGDREPEPMPESYDDVDPRLKTPELEKVYKQIEIQRFLDNGNYSVFDVLSGTAMVDALNHIDPEGDWELAT